MTVLFILFGVLQYNDPDPYLWMAIYAYAAYLCIHRFRGYYQPRGYSFALFFYLVYAIYLLFDKNGVIAWITQHDAESLVTSMKAEKPWIEESREFGGLLILSITMIINLVKKPVTT